MKPIKVPGDVDLRWIPFIGIAVIVWALFSLGASSRFINHCTGVPTALAVVLLLFPITIVAGVSPEIVGIVGILTLCVMFASVVVWVSGKCRVCVPLSKVTAECPLSAKED